MKICKTFMNKFFSKPKLPSAVKKEIPLPLIDYDPNNVTRGEYAVFVRHLAENNINYTFKEPPRFTTEAERKEKAELKKRIKRYRELAEEGIGITFSA